MKNAILQIKKLRGTCKVSNPEVNKVYFLNDIIYWTDFTTFYKKAISPTEFNINGNYSTDLKTLNDILKSIKEVKTAEIIDNVLIINESFKINVNQEYGKIIPEQIYNNENNLLNTNILENVNIKDLKLFINASSKYEYNVLQNICIKKDKLAVTDGNRLNILNITTKNINDDKVYLLPVNLIDNNLNKKASVYISTDNKYITAVNESQNEIITTCMNDGIYPKYEQLIPEYKTNAINFNKKELLDVLKQAKKIINTRTKVIVFDFINNKIKAKDEVLSEIEINFNFNYNGNLTYIAFNCDYLIDICNYMNDNFTLKLHETSKSACGIFENENKSTLLMPIKIDEKDYNIEFKKEVSIESDEAKEMIKTCQEVANKIETENEEISENTTKENEVIMKKETKTTQYEYVNAITKHVYNGENAIKLEKAGFNDCLEWVGSGQAKKLKKQVKKDSKGVVIKVYKENEDGQVFCKYETIYNVKHELEPIQVIENTSQFKDMINKFKNMFRKRA